MLEVRESERKKLKEVGEGRAVVLVDGTIMYVFRKFKTSKYLSAVALNARRFYIENTMDGNIDVDRELLSGEVLEVR